MQQIIINYPTTP